MRGFTLVELLVAMLIVAVVSASLLVVASPAPVLFQAQLEATDLQQRLRAAVDMLTFDLMIAGAGPTAGDAGSLASSTAAVLPYRHGLVDDDPRAGVFYRADTITVRYVASTALQPTETSHTYYLKFDAPSNGFQLMQYDGGRGDFPMLDNVVAIGFEYLGDPAPPQSIVPPPSGTDPDPLDEYPAGENCLFVRDGGGVTHPRLPPLAADSGLVRLAAALLLDGPWCPNALASDRFDADLLRIRQVGVRMRLQVGQAALRGPAGPLFAHAGSASSPYGSVPDQEIRFDVAPRNLAGAR
jgi:prepilin-type N-terminal cleavage/methylation domain-containing protein